MGIWHSSSDATADTRILYQCALCKSPLPILSFPLKHTQGQAGGFPDDCPTPDWCTLGRLLQTFGKLTFGIKMDLSLSLPLKGRRAGAEGAGEESKITVRVLTRAKNSLGTPVLSLKKNI